MKTIKIIIVIIILVALGFAIAWSVKTYYKSYGTEETVGTGQEMIDQAKDLKDQLNDRPNTLPEYK